MHNLFKLKIAVLFGVLSMVLLSLTMLVPSSGAEVSQINWPWSAGSYTIHSSTPISSIGESWCSSLIFQQKEVAGLTGAKDMCMMSGGNVQFGLYRDSTGFEAAVSLEDDSKMHKIFNICDLYDECLYLAGTDTLVRKEYLTGTSFRSLVVYKNFKNRLNSIFNPINLADEYVFDGTNPDYIFNNDNGTYAWLIGGRGASTNGKWLALEFYKRGIGLLNIETLQMKRVHALSFDYSAGANPSMEFAVSNDGAHIAMMGRNVGLRIVDITPDCGDIPTNANMYSGATVISACKDVSN